MSKYKIRNDRVNNLELYDKHLRCPQHKHLLLRWGECFTSAITKIIIKVCLEQKNWEYRRNTFEWVKRNTRDCHHIMKGGIEISFSHTANKYIGCFTFLQIQFGKRDERADRTFWPVWNTHEGPWLGSNQLCSIISRHKLERLPELSLPWWKWLHIKFYKEQ